jgi:transcriptional regulator with XRE-family HTH domain
MSTSTEGVSIPEWDLADRLAKALRVADTSVSEMALYLGVHRNTVSAWVNGRTPISGPAVRAWSTRTGVDHDWLVTGRHPKGGGGGGEGLPGTPNPGNPQPVDEYFEAA